MASSQQSDAEKFIQGFLNIYPDNKSGFSLKRFMSGFGRLLNHALTGSETDAFLKESAEEFRAKTASAPLPRELVQAFSDYFFKDLGFSCPENTESYFAGESSREEAGIAPLNELLPDIVCAKKSGACITIASLMLMLSDELYLPFYGVVMPSRFLVRYDDGTIKLDIDISSGGTIRGAPSSMKDDIIYGKTLEHYYTAAIFAGKAARVLTEQNMYAEADYLLKRCIESNPDLAESYYYRGLLNFRQNSLEAAEKDCLKAADKNPLYYEAYQALGVIASKKGNTKEAYACFKKAAGIKPDYIKPYLASAAMHYAAHDMQAARESYLEAIERGHESAEIYYRLGTIFYSEKTLRWPGNHSETL